MNEQKPAPLQLPTLQTALRLYLLVVLGTLAISILLTPVVPDVPFQRLLTAMFVIAGLMILTVILTGANLRAVFGFPPRIMFLATGFLAGVAIFLPATWLLFLSSQILGGLFGNLPFPSTAQPLTSFQGKFAIYGILIPLCQGLFFFGFIQTAARALGEWRGVIYTAILFGLYGFFSAGFGFAATLSYLLVGLVAGALTLRSGSPFVGALVISGFSLGELVYPADFIRSLAATGDVLSLQWLTSIFVAGFVTFLLIQLSRVFGVRRGTLIPKPPSPLWWSPLLLILLLSVALVASEINTRRQNQVISKPPPSTGSTLPPGAAASQTPQAANK